MFSTCTKFYMRRKILLMDPSELKHTYFLNHLNCLPLQATLSRNIYFFLLYYLQIFNPHIHKNMFSNAHTNAVF